ncbi:MAG TPA: Rpn family recombination-promoting nuclease/putative transposase [Polyangiaceae bacterium]|jgi:predicted transposase/invertase (TIGR01784 family)
MRRRLYEAGRASGARSELELVLPPDVRSLLDFATLEVCPGSFVDPELQQAHSDLLFRVQTKADEESFVYVLFEHQSSPDSTMPFRLLRYVVRVWERWLEDHRGTKTLPVVVPVVLHHGEAPWTVTPELGAMLEGSNELLDATRPFVPHFRFVLDDLMQESAEDLANRPLAPLPRLVQLAMWASRSFPRLALAKEFMRGVVALLSRDDRARTLLTQVYYYLLGTAPPEVEESAITGILLEIAGPEGREDVLNAGEKLMERGRLEGLERGRVEGLRDGIAAVLQARSVSLTGVGHARIAKCSDPALLTSWLTRAASAASEEEIFGTEQ